MMPPPLHVYNGLSSTADAAAIVYSTVKFVKSFATRQHRYDVDSNFVVSCSLLSGTISPKLYSVDLLVVVITSPNFIATRSVFV